MTNQHLREPEGGRPEAPPAAIDSQTFLDQLDHDLRTPLGTMAAALELLRAEPAMTPSQAESIAVLQRQVARLHMLTERLREFSRTLGT